MNIRVLAGLLIILTVSTSCTKHIAETSPNPPTQTTQKASPKRIPPTNNFPDNLAVNLQPEIVRILQAMDASAWDFYVQGNLLESRRLFEEALDIIADYEEDENYIRYPEYINSKNSILRNFREVLRREGFDINDTDSDILQQEIEILRVIQNAERESDITPNVSLSVGERVKPIPVEMNSSVQKWISRFAYGNQRKHFKVYIERSGKYLPMIFEVLDQEGMPRELAYLAMIESGFNPVVRSYARAVGLWQFISATGKRNGLKIDGYIDERRDPFKATRAAVKHLRDLYFYWDENWYLALSGYNVSERRIRQAISRYKTRDFWKLGWPLPRQTRDYVPKFLAAVEVMKNPRKYGFAPPVMQPIQFEEVEIFKQASLDVIAQAAVVDEKIIRDLNTELKIYITPEINSKNKSYTIRLPKGANKHFAENFNAIPNNELITKLTYTVRRGDTISEISDLFKVDQRQIMLVNNISNARRLQIGQRLTIPRPSSGFTPGYIERSITASTALAVPSDSNRRQKIDYIVRKNDTLWDIAQAHRVSVRNLQAWNGLSRNRYIYPNQKLAVWLPQSASVAVQIQTNSNNSSNSGNRQVVHTVRRGDSISRIGNKYGITVNNLLSWNNLTNRSVIHPGDSIYLLPDDETRAAIITADGSEIKEERDIVYTVKRGDTLWEIAQFHDTSVSAIKSVNNLRSSNLIRPGDKLVIPFSQSDSRALTYR